MKFPSLAWCTSNNGALAHELLFAKSLRRFAPDQRRKTQDDVVIRLLALRFDVFVLALIRLLECGKAEPPQVDRLATELCAPVERFVEDIDQFGPELDSTGRLLKGIGGESFSIHPTGIGEWASNNVQFLCEGIAREARKQQVHKVEHPLGHDLGFGSDMRDDLLVDVSLEQLSPQSDLNFGKKPCEGQCWFTEA